MTQVPVACRACGSTSTVVKYVVNALPLCRCATCGSLTTDTVMDTAAAEDFYSSDYFRGGDYSDYRGSEVFLKDNFGRFADRLRSLSTGGRLLEVGCAYGFFLDIAQE